MSRIPFNFGTQERPYDDEFSRISNYQSSSKDGNMTANFSSEAFDGDPQEFSVGQVEQTN
jgi:hypothetical protein